MSEFFFFLCFLKINSESLLAVSQTHFSWMLNSDLCQGCLLSLILFSFYGQFLLERFHVLAGLGMTWCPPTMVEELHA